MPLSLGGNGVISGIDWAGTGGGLAHITTSSFSAASSVSVNNCFTSTYENYLLIANFSGSTTQEVSIRMRASGVDSSTSIYDRAQVVWETTAQGQTVNAAQWGFNILTTYNSRRWFRAEMLAPQLSQNTQIIMTHGESNGSSERIGVLVGSHKAASAQDGFTLYPSTGTITGTVRVYGYIND